MSAVTDIEITDTWNVVDRWWTDAPERRYYAAVRSPDVAIDVRAVVVYDETTKEWSLIAEPTAEAVGEPREERKA